MLGGSQIIKRRYPYDYGEYKYAIDVFEGTLAGLILEEIESRPEVDIETLPTPDFAFREVTGDPYFSGENLAGLTEVEILTMAQRYRC